MQRIEYKYVTQVYSDMNEKGLKILKKYNLKYEKILFYCYLYGIGTDIIELQQQ